MSFGQILQSFRRDRQESNQAESRLSFPSERTCPPEVLGRLRAIDDTAELLYTGHGRWMLGSVAWRWPIVEAAATTLRKLRGNASRIGFFDLGRQDSETLGATWSEQLERARSNAERAAFMKLAVQGFRPIAEYHYPDPDERIVRDFRIRDWNYRVCPEQTVNESIEYAAGVPQQNARIATLLDAARAKGWDALRHVVRGKGFVVNPGIGAA